MASACACAPKTAPVTPTPTKSRSTGCGIAAEAARAIADSRGDAPAAVQVGRPVPRHQLYELESTPLEVPLEERAKLLDEIDASRANSTRGSSNVMASFSAERKIVMVVNSEGRIAADVQPLCRLNVTVIAEDDKGRQVGSFGRRRTGGMEVFSSRANAGVTRATAARQAIINLDAVDAPGRRDGGGAGARMARHPAA